ncbi:MAG: hypothetical protein NC324_08355 [Bacteroides sp.]|nr:hypothetical protein [Bacteroides sp.]
MTEILLSIAGIIFGGGMIGQLVIFFTKRHDAKNKATNELLNNLIKRICEVQKTINDILGKITDADNQVKSFLLRQIELLETENNKEKALSEELSALYNHPEDKDICIKCIEIRKRYPLMDIEANKAERESIKQRIFNETNTYIRDQIKGLDMFPNLSSDFLCLKKSIRRQLLQLTSKYQKVYYKLKYTHLKDYAETQSHSDVDNDLFELLGQSEQMKSVISNYIKH